MWINFNLSEGYFYVYKTKGLILQNYNTDKSRFVDNAFMGDVLGWNDKQFSIAGSILITKAEKTKGSSSKRNNTVYSCNTSLYGSESKIR